MSPMQDRSRKPSWESVMAFSLALERSNRESLVLELISYSTTKLSPATNQSHENKQKYAASCNKITAGSVFSNRAKVYGGARIEDTRDGP